MLNPELTIVSLDSPNYAKGAKHYSVGPESIAANTGIRTTHFDLQVSGSTAVSQHLQDTLPPAVLLSTKIGSAESLTKIVTTLAEIIRAQTDWNPYLVLGGVYATFAPEIVGDAVIDLLGTADRLALIRRQGEVPVKMLVKQLLENNSINWRGIPNAVFQDEGVWQRSSHHADLYRFSALNTPDTQTVPLILEEDGVVWAEFTRGCASHCTFCAISELRGDHSVDMQDEEKVVQHLLQLADMGVSVVSFSDDDFPIAWRESGDMAAPLHTHKLAQRMIEAGLHNRLKWTISTRASNIFDPNDTPEQAQVRRKALSDLKTAGLYEIFIGAETFAPDQAKRYGIAFESTKHTRTKKTHDCTKYALKILDEMGISVVAGFIPFDPLMTNLDELAINMQGLIDTGLWRHVTNPVNTMRVQADTAYQRLCEKAGISMTRSDFVFFDAEYANPTVGVVAQIAHDWAHELVKTNYGLKFIRNSSTISNELKSLAQEYLETFRWQELHFIKELATVATEHDQLHAMRKKYEIERLSILRKLQRSQLNSIPTLAGGLSEEIQSLQKMYE